MINMLHNESRNLLVQEYKKNHNAKQTAQDFSVSEWTVYRLRKQMKQTDRVDPCTSQRGRKANCPLKIFMQLMNWFRNNPILPSGRYRRLLTLLLSRTASFGLLRLDIANILWDCRKIKIGVCKQREYNKGDCEYEQRNRTLISRNAAIFQ